MAGLDKEHSSKNNLQDNMDNTEHLGQCSYRHLFKADSRPFCKISFVFKL